MTSRARVEERMIIVNGIYFFTLYYADSDQALMEDLIEEK